MSKTISFTEMSEINRYHVARIGPWKKSSSIPGFDWPGATKREYDPKYQNPGTVNDHFIWFMPYSLDYTNLYDYARDQHLIAREYMSTERPPYTRMYENYPSLSRNPDCILLMDEVAKEAGLFPDHPSFLSDFVRTHPMSSVALYLQNETVKGGYKYRWVAVFIDYDYYSSNRLLTSIGTESDFKDMIRYIRYGSLCGITLSPLQDTLDFKTARPLFNNEIRKNIDYIAETVRRSATSYFMDQIESLLNLTKFGDVPSLHDDLDDLLNNKLRDFDLELAESDFATVKDQSYIKREGKILYPDEFDRFLKKELDISLLTALPMDRVWGSLYTKYGNKDMVIYEFDAYGNRIPEDYKSFRISLPISEDMALAIKDETARIRKLVIQNAEKATAALIAYEDESALEHTDALDPSENPFLIYSRDDSEQVKTPLFKDISIRPGKPQGGLVKNRRIPYSAFKKVPSRLTDIIRSPDEEGRYVPGGGKGTDGNNILIKLAALGAGGYFLYKQAGG